MKSQNPRDTIGKIAKEYGYNSCTFWVILKGFNDLYNELQDYLKDTKQKGKKFIPPSLQDKIFAALGEP